MSTDVTRLARIKNTIAAAHTRPEDIAWLITQVENHMMMRSRLRAMIDLWGELGEDDVQQILAASGYSSSAEPATGPSSADGTTGSSSAEGTMGCSSSDGTTPTTPHPPDVLGACL